jgi:hypothetical protein
LPTEQIADREILDRSVRDVSRSDDVSSERIVDSGPNGRYGGGHRR